MTLKATKKAIANIESNFDNTDLLQLSIASLENEIKSKDRIIQSLLETQNTLTNSLSILKAKQPETIINLCQQQQRQHQKYHHQYQVSSSSTTSKAPTATKPKQQSSEQSQKSPRQQKQQGLGNQKQIILGQDQLDTLYVGNLSEDINESDLFELFGLRTTNYLPDNSDVQIPPSDINKKLRELCMKHNFEFIDHEQITSKFLWNDGIHLLDTGKSILGQNFVNRVSNFFKKNDSFFTDPHFQETIR